MWIFDAKSVKITQKSNLFFFDPQDYTISTCQNQYDYDILFIG